MRYWFDTESCGFYGPTILIQYRKQVCGEEPGPVTLVNVFQTPAGEVLELVEQMMEGYLIGFNLTHDIFHLARTYNVLKTAIDKCGHDPAKSLTVSGYFEAEGALDWEHQYALHPRRALDLMLFGREGYFQSTMNQKPIVIRRFPRDLAPFMVEHLEKNIKFPSIMFSKRDGKPQWRIQLLHKDTPNIVTPEELSKNREDPAGYPLQIDPHFVHIRLDFHPAAGLKDIAEHMLGMEVSHYELSSGAVKPEEFGFAPTLGNYRDVIDGHLRMWETDQNQLRYARMDVEYTEAIYKLFKEEHNLRDGYDDSTDGEHFDPVNHDLACHVGNVHWSGMSVNVELAKAYGKRRIKLLSHFQSKYDGLNVNAPKQVLRLLHSKMTPVERLVTTKSDKATLTTLSKMGQPYSKVARHILKARRWRIELDLCLKLVKAKRFHATMKVVGTKSNRMAGGSMNAGDGTKINPQGIAKGTIRKLFTFFDAYNNELVGSGDFDGFEVAIMEAVYADPLLREDLLSGKKIHALWGEALYGLSYDEMLNNKVLYNKAKTSLFADLYGAFEDKLATVTGLTAEEVVAAKKNFSEKYSKIGEGREKIKNDFSAIKEVPGTRAYKWEDPKPYVESLLGFKRFFTVEWEVVHALYELTQHLPPEIKNCKLKVRRSSRVQTQGGAAMSAIYSAAFSLQNAIVRAAGNHIIQSVGGQVTKRLQHRLLQLQPKGVQPWSIKLMNVHDEIDSACRIELQQEAAQIVHDFLEEYRSMIPLIAMKWETNKRSWAEAH